MPKYTVVVDTLLHFDIEASTPEEAEQQWRKWVEDQIGRHLPQNLRILALGSTMKVVLDENGISVKRNRSVRD